jgi:NhaA family Na+:H+ antiporter
MSNIMVTARTRVVDPLREFVRAEVAGGIVLLGAALIALAWANSPFSAGYERLWSTELSVGTGPLGITADLQHWVNEGLMAVFFFVVGLEIKRELVTGALRERRAAVLPAAAAAGGVLLPALLFAAIAGGGPASAGWGIPMATDVAFAIGVLALLGDRVPAGARLFLLGIAIVDDLIAIVVISVFYSASLTWGWLAVAAAGLVVVLGLRRIGIFHIWPYALVGLLVWYATYRSGVHATIAGVALALLTPARPFRGREVLTTLEHRLHPLSAWAVVPLFALANAGVDLRGGLLTQAATSRLAWAVAAGLIVGKTIGIAAVTLAAVRARLGVLPAGVRTVHIWGLSAVAGIGFTVSLFITGLAYQAAGLVSQAKVGIFAGSLASAAAGVIILLHSRRGPGRLEETEPESRVQSAATSGARPGSEQPRIGPPYPRHARPAPRVGAAADDGVLRAGSCIADPMVASADCAHRWVMTSLPSLELRARVRSPGDEGGCAHGYRRVGLRLRSDPITGQGRVWQWVVDVDSGLPALTDMLATCHGFLVDDDCGRLVGVVEDVELDPGSAYPVRLLVVLGWGRHRIMVPAEDVIELAPGGRRLVVACRAGHRVPARRPEVTEPAGPMLVRAAGRIRAWLAGVQPGNRPRR